MRVVIAGLLAGTIGFAATVQAQTALERGKYLVEGIVGCGNCHTPPLADHTTSSRRPSRCSRPA